MPFKMTLSALSVRKSSLVLAITSALALSACGESTSTVEGPDFGQTPTPTQPTQDFNETALLTSIADNVIAPTYARFLSEAQSQAQTVLAYCDAVKTGADASTQKAAAIGQWQATMAIWQMAEVMQVGPLTENNSELRNRIYSWPNVSSCAVDQDVVRSEEVGYNIATRTSTRKGLDALEYLLHNNNLDHSCTQFGSAPENWNNRDDQTRLVARCEFATIVANDLVNNAEELVNRWQGDAGFAANLKAAGTATSQFADTHTAVNRVSDALFYVDKFTKDAKIATPLGKFANDCGLVPCAENVESVYGKASVQHIINNLKGLKLLFQGGEAQDAVGFDDYLVEVGAEFTAEQMHTDIKDAIVFAESLEQTLQGLLEQNPSQVETLHGDVKAVTDTMKADFIQALSLELPATSAGDND